MHFLHMHFLLIHVVPLVLIFLASCAGTLAKGCRILFDGRIPSSATGSDFDKPTSIYDYQFVHGQNQTWAEILKFPVVQPSMFDIASKTKAIEVTINDNSIFLSGEGGLQTGFRRSELIPATNNGTDVTVEGTTTFHWSVRNDPLRPLNFSHEYHPVWHETEDFSTSEFTFLTGTPFNHSFDPNVTNPKTLRVAGRQSNSPEITFFQTPFEDDVWHNFAITMGWISDEITIYYSKGHSRLEVVVGPTFNNNSGGGQFHAGLLKLPTGPLGIDVLHEGFQETHLNEGLIYSGVFIESSLDSCVTTVPPLI